MITDSEKAANIRRAFEILMRPLLGVMDDALESGFAITYATNIDPQDKKHKLVLLKITKEFAEEPPPQPTVELRRLPHEEGLL